MVKKYTIKFNVKSKQETKPIYTLFLRSHQDNFTKIFKIIGCGTCELKHDKRQQPNTDRMYYFNIIEYKNDEEQFKIGTIKIEVFSKDDIEELETRLKKLDNDISLPLKSGKNPSRWIITKKVKYYNQQAYWNTNNIIQPKYPIYILSKGRHDKKSLWTYNALREMQIDFKIVIEKQEEKLYLKNVEKKYILILPKTFIKKQNEIGNFGGIPSRNFIWQHSINQGYKKHWILDDNINGFYRLNNNCRRKIKSGVIFKILEDYTDRFNDVYLSSFQYKSMIPEISLNRPPIVINTRCYSCILIDNELDIKLNTGRWRGKYNEDVDLSIRVMKNKGYTLLMQNLQQNKLSTGSCKGGNSDIYANDGLKKKTESLIAQHPGIVSFCARFSKKYHHYIDYKKHFKRPLIFKDEIENLKNCLKDTNDYNLKIF